MLYILVGWIVISIAKLFMGDPLTVYLEASHSDVVYIVTVLVSLAFHGAVGFAVLRGLKGLVTVEDRKNIKIRTALLRKYDDDWEVRLQIHHGHPPMSAVF